MNLVRQHVGAILSTIVIGVLLYIVYLLGLAPKFGWNLYETEIAVALTVIAIGVGWKGFSPYLRKLGYDISAFEKEQQEIKENEEQAKEHRITLNDSFVRARDTCFLEGLTWTETFQRFRDSKHYLQHFYTGHIRLDGMLRAMISLELEGKKHMTEERQKAMLQEAVLLFQQQFNELQGQIRRKSRNLGGICEECIYLQDEKNRRTKLLKKYLENFTMPF